MANSQINMWKIVQIGEFHTLAELKKALQNASNGKYDPFELAY